MSVINTNLSSLIAQNVLSQQNTSLNTSLQRLSTGLQINSGADNPAGLIATESLQSNIAAINSALSNAQSAGQVINTADGGLGQVNSLLLQVQSLVTASANSTGQSASEKTANQQQIDSILQSIDQIASTTSFNGTQLLNGNLDFQVTGQNSNVSALQVFAAKSSTAPGTKVAVNTIITTSAHHGTLYLSAGATSLNLSSSTAQFSFNLAGALGAQTFSFGSGTTLSSIASSVDNFKSVTGVSAVASGNYLKLQSTDFGSSQFVSFQVSNRGGQAGGVALASSTNESKASTSGGSAFSALSGTVALRAKGQDVGALINGQTTTGSGSTIKVDSDNLALQLTLTNTAAQTLGNFSAFTIAGGGATFNLGANVNLDSQASLGIGSVASNSLGTSGLGFLSQIGSGGSLNVVNGDIQTAQQVVNAAINQVSTLRGRLGAFENFVVGSTENTLNVALENSSAANSAIEDTNFASETANLSRSQILVSSATQVLSIANSQPQNVLKLLQSA